MGPPPRSSLLKRIAASWSGPLMGPIEYKVAARDADNRVGCSMTRLLCLRLRARPSGAGETGHTFRAATVHRVEGAQADAANTDRLVPRAPPLAGPGRSPDLTSLPRFPGPETDMTSIGPVMPTARQSCATTNLSTVAADRGGGSSRTDGTASRLSDMARHSAGKLGGYSNSGPLALWMDPHSLTVQL
jgi:hypothetical protein